jgi:hypothetical protein
MFEWNSFDWFVFGLLIGYAWSPLWAILKTIVQEVRLVRQEWRQHNRK